MYEFNEVSAGAAVQITRAAPMFDHLVEAVLAERTPEGKPAVAGGALRERLDWFFPEFRELYFQLLREHLGADLTRVLSALSDDSVQLYFRSLQSMQPELRERLQRLGQRMASALGG
jgi:hypothetical protein